MKTISSIAGVVSLIVGVVACDKTKEETKAAEPAPTVTATATANAPVTTAAAHPGAPATTATATAAVGNGAGKGVTASTSTAGANVNLQNNGKQGNIGTTPGNVQVGGAAGTINIPTGGGLPTRAP